MQALKYWKCLLESDDTTTIRNAYTSLYESLTLGQVNWCPYIKNILDDTNNIEIWKSQCISNSQILTLKIYYMKALFLAFKMTSLTKFLSPLIIQNKCKEKCFLIPSLYR